MRISAGVDSRPNDGTENHSTESTAPPQAARTLLGGQERITQGSRARQGRKALSSGRQSRENRQLDDKRLSISLSECLATAPNHPAVKPIFLVVYNQYGLATVPNHPAAKPLRTEPQAGCRIRCLNRMKKAGIPASAILRREVSRPFSRISTGVDSRPNDGMPR